MLLKDMDDLEKALLDISSTNPYADADKRAEAYMLGLNDAMKTTLTLVRERKL